jgi:hypothetical protein
MSTVETSALPDLVQRMPGDIDHLIVSASYEERAFGVWEHIHDAIRGRKFICFNANHESYLRDSMKRFSDLDGQAGLVPLDSNDPPTTFEAIKGIIDGLRDAGVCHLAIDLTGFTREALAILIYLAKWRLSEGSRLTAFYHKAIKYGRTPKRGWLSQGIREVRSVLGYAGQMRLSANTHLILLGGFETERAQEIIDTIEPSLLSLGMIARAQPSGDDSNPHDEALKEFTTRMRSFYAGTHFAEFQFSSSDPIYTRDSLLAVSKASNRNVVLACLNSKPAMVGACLAAIEYPMIQLIYAQPLYYNTTSYSEPSGKILFFPIPL